jgi:hypothetical protein
MPRERSTNCAPAAICQSSGYDRVKVAHLLCAVILTCRRQGQGTPPEWPKISAAQPWQAASVRIPMMSPTDSEIMSLGIPG